MRPSFALWSRLLKSEGAGNTGRSMHPQPCAQNKKAHKRSHHGHTGFTRHSPHNGFNELPRALPGDQDFLTPSPADNSAKLNAYPEASGPHAFTVRFRTLRQWCIHVHRIPLRVRDDREPPLWKERDGVRIFRKLDAVKLNYEYQNKRGRHTPRVRGIQYAAAYRFNYRLQSNTGSPAGACRPAGQKAGPGGGR
jgi:hypothetical protein